MTQASTICIAPPLSNRLLAKVKTAFRALRRRRARAAQAAAVARRWTAAKQDLAHLDRRILRDIGLDRDAM